MISDLQTTYLKYFFVFFWKKKKWGWNVCFFLKYTITLGFCVLTEHVSFMDLVIVFSSVDHWVHLCTSSGFFSHPLLDCLLSTISFQAKRFMLRRHIPEESSPSQYIDKTPMKIIFEKTFIQFYVTDIYQVPYVSKSTVSFFCTTSN